MTRITGGTGFCLFVVWVCMLSSWNPCGAAILDNLPVTREVCSVPFVVRSVSSGSIGAQVAFVGSDSAVMSLLVRYGGFDVHRVIRQGERLVNYGWSASGQHLAYSTVRSNGSAYLLVYDTATGQSRRITRNEDGEETYFSWTGSNSFLFAYRAPNSH